MSLSLVMLNCLKIAVSTITHCLSLTTMPAGIGGDKSLQKSSIGGL
jgi:hypothetical protein